MSGMAVLLLVRPTVRHRDRLAQRAERGDGAGVEGEHLDRAREHRGSNAGFLLGHHLGSGRPRQSDGSVAAVRDETRSPTSRRFAMDSLLEEAGFEPSVPRKTPAVVVRLGLAAPPSPLWQGE